MCACVCGCEIIIIIIVILIIIIIIIIRETSFFFNESPYHYKDSMQSVSLKLSVIYMLTPVASLLMLAKIILCNIIIYMYNDNIIVKQHKVEQ